MKIRWEVKIQLFQKVTHLTCREPNQITFHNLQHWSKRVPSPFFNTRFDVSKPWNPRWSSRVLLNRTSQALPNIRLFIIEIKHKISFIGLSLNIIKRFYNWWKYRVWRTVEVDCRFLHLSQVSWQIRYFTEGANLFIGYVNNENKRICVHVLSIFIWKSMRFGALIFKNHEAIRAREMDFSRRIAP